MYEVAELEPDRRGNVVQHWAIRGNPGEQRVHLRAAFAVARHLKSILTALEASPQAAPFAAGEGWTHCYEINREIDELEGMLRQFERCLVLQDLPREVDSAIALDFYKIPRDGSDPFTWPNTEIGDLVNRMKYWDDPVASTQAREDLADLMSDLIRHHPIYRTATLVAVPGHDARKVAASEHLAVAVADRLSRPLVRVRSKTLLRPETKSLNGRVDLRSEFTVPDTVPGYASLILDDVYERGRTMQGVAAALRASGVREIHGLVAARTST